MASIGTGGMGPFARSHTGQDNLGRVAKISSHRSPTDDPNDTNNVKKQVVFTYNDLGEVTKSEQSHSGVVVMGTNSVQYGYDTSAVSAIYATNNKDEAYTYNLYRLDLSQQGTLSGSTITGTPVREEDWTLDALGNISNYLTKANGTTTLNQPRTHNDANEEGQKGATHDWDCSTRSGQRGVVIAFE